MGLDKYVDTHYIGAMKASFDWGGAGMFAIAWAFILARVRHILKRDSE